MGLTGHHLGNANAAVHDVSDETTISAPGKCGSNLPRITCNLHGGTAVRRHHPKLRDALLVFHEKCDVRTIGRTAQPVPWALQPGVFAIGGERQAALGRAFGRKRQARLGACHGTVSRKRVGSSGKSTMNTSEIVLPKAVTTSP